MKRFEIPNVLMAEDTMPRKIYATFLEEGEGICADPYDLEFYEKPNLKQENPMAVIYDQIFSDMNNPDATQQTSITKSHYMQRIKEYLDFEKIRPHVENFIQKIFSENPEYKFVRIHY